MRTVVSLAFLCLLLGACGTKAIDTPRRIVLLAPFEGRYREVGYQAYYAAQLAFSEGVSADLELVAIDDGGTLDSAIERARAIQMDSRVVAVIALGYDSTDAQVAEALNTIPLVVAGFWDVGDSLSENLFVLANAEIANIVTLPAHTAITALNDFSPPYVGAELLMLDQFSRLITIDEGVQVASSFALPDDDFKARFLNVNQFAPEPNLIAVTAYETTRYVLSQIEHLKTENRLTPQDLRVSLLNSGDFEEGFNTRLPIFLYQYDDDGKLLPVDRVVKER